VTDYSHNLPASLVNYKRYKIKCTQIQVPKCSGKIRVRIETYTEANGDPKSVNLYNKNTNLKEWLSPRRDDCTETGTGQRLGRTGRDLGSEPANRVYKIKLGFVFEVLRTLIHDTANGIRIKEVSWESRFESR
jgi:hypothetical protein